MAPAMLERVVGLSIVIWCANARAEPVATFPSEPPPPAVAPAAQPPAPAVPPPRWYYSYDYPPPLPPPRPRRDEDESWTERWEGRPLTLLGQVGFGTPTGNLGALIEANVTSWLTLSLGVGESSFVGADGNRGHTVDHASPLQLAAGARVRLPLGTLAVSVGAGVSEGGYERRWELFADSSESPLHIWDHAAWTNLDLALEGRARRGFQWRVFVGSGRMLHPGEGDRCEPATQSDWCPGWGDKPITLLLIGAAFGYAFEI